MHRKQLESIPFPKFVFIRVHSWPKCIALAALLIAPVFAQAPDYQADGIKALDAKNYPLALDFFTKAVAADPQDYAAHFHLALSYSLLDKFPEAIPEYRKVLDLKPHLYDAELNLGMCLLRVKDAATAAPILKDAADQKPKEFRPVYYYGQALLDQHQFADAERAFTAAVALNPSSPAAEVGLAQALAQQAKLADSEPHFRRAAALDPGYKPALLQLAELYEAAKQLPQAIAIYREFPENPGAQERMGALLSQSGDATEAVSALEVAVARSPSAANRVALAQAYVKNKQPDKAIPLATQAVAAEPNDFELRMYLGRLLRDQRKFNEAASQFLAASKLKADAVQPWNELASVMIVSEQYPQALAALDRVQALGGETSAHLYLRAISYDHLHQQKEALANYNKFLEQSQGKSPDEEFKARQRARIIQNELNKK
jgi:tetratricopeptide (TPR) repeat protein